MAMFDKKENNKKENIQNETGGAQVAPKVAVAPDKGRAGAPAAAPGGYAAQRAATAPAGAGYDTQREAVRPEPGVPTIGGLALEPLPAGPTSEPRKKKKKKNNQNNRPTPAPTTTTTTTPTPTTTTPTTTTPATTTPAATTTPPTTAPAKPADPLRDASANPDPTNEYAASATYMTLNGTIAVQGEGDAHAIDANDVKQGSIGNCYFVAQLAAQAKADPSVIQNLIKDNGDGSYTVSLWLKDKRQPWKRTKTDVVVDSQFPTSGGGGAAYAKPGDAGSSGPELWVMLIEKAFAKYVGHYEETRGKKTPDSDVFGMMTGVASGYRAMSSLADDALLKLCEAAVRSHKPVSFGAINNTASEELQNGAKEAGVVLNHAYALEGVDAGKRTLSLRNPWGVKHLFDTDVAVVRKFYDGVRVGG